MAETTWYFTRAGQRQGPVSADELRRALAAGGVAATDLVWRDGMGEWMPAGRMAELAVPPPVRGGPVSYYSPSSPGPGQGIGQDAGIRLLLPVGRSGWAIAAGYFGLFSVLACPAPIALIVSILAIQDMKKHPDRHGMGRAVFGLVMGLLGTALLIFFLVVTQLGGHHRGRS